MANKVRLAIIGCGGIARSRHITGLGLLKQAGLDLCEVVACCDTVEENARRVAENRSPPPYAASTCSQPL